MKTFFIDKACLGFKPTMQILTSYHDTGTIEITYMEETLAELWANSAAAREEFPEHPDVVRRAVRPSIYIDACQTRLGSLCMIA